MRFLTNRFFNLIAVSAVLMAGLFAALTIESSNIGITALPGVIIVCASFIPWMAAMWGIWKITDSSGSGFPLLLLLVIGFLLRVILIPAEPLFSDDIYRFLWDGRVQNAGISPWAFAPNSEHLRFLRDADWTKINNPELRTIYPTVAELVFRVSTWMFDSIYSLKFVAIAADLCVIWMIYLLAEEAPGEPTPKRAVFSAALYGLNPLPCVETAMSGHLLEPLAVATLLGAIVTAQRWQRVRNSDFATSALLCAGVGMKLAPILMLFAFPQRRKKIALIALIMTALILLPMLLEGSRGVETLDAFTRRWESNSGLFRLIKGFAIYSVGAIHGTSDPAAMIHLSFLDGPARLLQNSFFALHKDGAYDPAYPGAFPLIDIALAIARVTGAAIVGATLLYTIVKRISPVRAGFLLFGALLLVTPVLHPWYALWILPFASLKRHPGWFAFAAMLPLSYLSLTSWWQSHFWVEYNWVLIAEYGVFAVVTFGYFVLSKITSRQTAQNALSS